MVFILLLDQQPAALRKLSYGLDAGSLKKWGWCRYSVAQCIGAGSMGGLCKLAAKF